MSGIHSTPPIYASDQEKSAGDKDINIASRNDEFRASFSEGSKRDNTHRKLKARHIQLIGIGGTIGTALYVRTSVHCFPVNPLVLCS